MTQAGLGASFAPKHAMSKLPGLYATEHDGKSLDDKPLLAHWFSPYTGWDWYACEADAETGRCFGYVIGSEPEWGYFSLPELASLRLMNGRLPAVERDHYFEPTTLGELRAAGRVR